MDTVDFKDAFKQAVDRQATATAMDQMARDRREIGELLEQMCAQMQEALGADVQVLILPWLSTPDAERKQVVFRKVGGAHDGFEVKAFEIALPPTGYPVQLDVSGQTHAAGNKQELEQALLQVLSASPVPATARQLQAL